MVRLKDIADEAGLAIATVSAVINGNGRIAPATRERIMTIANRLNYSPNTAAKALKNKPTVDIGMIISDNLLFNGIMDQLLNGCNRDRLSYQLELVSYKNMMNQIPAMLRQTLASGLLHIGYFNEEVREFLQSHPEIPMVVMGEKWDYCVRTDFSTGTFQALQYLAAAGHHDIAISYGNQKYDIHRHVKKGLLQALDTFNINIADDLWFTELSKDYGADAGMFSAVEWARSIMQLPKRPTAVFCSGVATAAATIYAAMECGLRVPEQLSVVSVSAEERDSYHVYPQLSSIEYDHQRMATESMQLLQRRINNLPIDQAEIMVDSKLVLRDSIVKNTKN